MATEKNIWTATNSNTAPYARMEEKQASWDGYQADLSPEDLARLDTDNALYRAVSTMFFGAKNPEELEKYASMGLEELARLAAETYAAYLASVEETQQKP